MQRADGALVNAGRRTRRGPQRGDRAHGHVRVTLRPEGDGREGSPLFDIEGEAQCRRRESFRAACDLGAGPRWRLGGRPPVTRGCVGRQSYPARLVVHALERGERRTMPLEVLAVEVEDGAGPQLSADDGLATRDRSPR